jgi:hypothetical protein
VSGTGWADGVAAVHAVVVLLVLAGGLAGLRWPGVRRVHLPVLAAALAVNVTGSDCPLTTLELRLRRGEGGAGYSGGFVGHYLLEPVLGTGSAGPSVPGLVLAAAVVPNLVAYGVPLLRWTRERTRQGWPVGQWLAVPRRDSSRGGTSRSASRPVASE